MSARRPFPPARLACGCTLAVHDRTESRGISVMVQSKSESCPLPTHVAGMPLYDHRHAVRPATRVHPHVQPDWEE
jgi:hypothetical protein